MVLVGETIMIAVTLKLFVEITLHLRVGVLITVLAGWRRAKVLKMPGIK